MKKNWGICEGVFLFREGVFAILMKHPPCPLYKGDIKKGMKDTLIIFEAYNWLSPSMNCSRNMFSPSNTA